MAISTARMTAQRMAPSVAPLPCCHSAYAGRGGTFAGQAAKHAPHAPQQHFEHDVKREEGLWAFRHAEHHGVHERPEAGVLGRRRLHIVHVLGDRALHEALPRALAARVRVFEVLACQSVYPPG